MLVLYEGVEYARCIFDLAVGPLQIADDPVRRPGGPSTFSILGEFAPEDFRVLHITRSIWQKMMRDFRSGSTQTKTSAKSRLPSAGTPQTAACRKGSR